MEPYTKDIYCFSPEGICSRYTVNENQYCSDLGFDTTECYEEGTQSTTTTTSTTTFRLNLPCVSQPNVILLDGQECCSGLIAVPSATAVGGRICVGTGGTTTTTTTSTTTAAPTPPPGSPPPAGPNTQTQTQLQNSFVWQFDGFDVGELPDEIIYRRFTSDTIPTYRVTLKNLSDTLYIDVYVTQDTPTYIRVIDDTQNLELRGIASTSPKMQLGPTQSRDVRVTFDTAGMNNIGNTVPQISFYLDGFVLQ
jgi:hypothetical protein